MSSRHALILRLPLRDARANARGVPAAVRVFLLICLVWQALTLAGQLKLPMQSPEELGHLASMHWSEKLHHHEEGGQPHQDASQQSIDHLAQDDLIDPPILCLECSRISAFRMLANAPPYRGGVRASLALEPLRKPPKLA